MITGGCDCGQVRYSVKAEPLCVANCHCHACQEQSGNPFVTVMFVLLENLEITGECASYVTVADSGNNMTRSYCADCGSNLFGKSSVTDRIRPVMVDTLDDQSEIDPQMNFWLSSKSPDTVVDETLISYDGQFTRFPKKEY